MKFALVLGNWADFGDLGDLGAVGELGGTALVGLIGGNLGFRAFTSHPDVETAVACSKQIYNESDTRRIRKICKNWLAYDRLVSSHKSIWIKVDGARIKIIEVNIRKHEGRMTKKGKREREK